MTTWAEVEPAIRDSAYRRIDADPQILLEDDSEFELEADLIYARLFGFDGEVVHDGRPLFTVVPKILVPIVTPARVSLGGTNQPEDTIDYETYRYAAYHLQSTHITLRVSGEYGPPVAQLADDHTATVAYLRYRRRS